MENLFLTTLSLHLRRKVTPKEGMFKGSISEQGIGVRFPFLCFTCVSPESKYFLYNIDF